MPHTVSYDAEANLVHLVLSGRIDYPAAETAMRGAFEIVHREDCLKILTDLRDARMVLTLLEFYELPRKTIALGELAGVNARLTRRAFLAKFDLQLLQFYEMTARSQGLVTRLFLEEEQARKWLAQF